MPDLDGAVLDTVFARSPLATACHDRRLRVVYVNAAMAALGAAPASASRGRPLPEIPPAIGAALRPCVEHVLETGTAVTDLAIGGRDRHWSASCHPLHASDATIVGVCSILCDDTERFATERRLRECEEGHRRLVEVSPDGIALIEAPVAEWTARIAEASERLRKETMDRAAVERDLHLAARLAAIGTLAAGVAHEINNPLASIVATAELARAMNADDARDEVDAALARIVDEAHRGGDIVKGLLRLGHVTDGERWPVDLNALVRALTESPHVRQVLGRCRLRTRLVRRPIRVVIDPTELEHLVLNLVQNAVQADAKEITLRTVLRGDWARLVVCDDGRGIEPADVERIFDPFFTTRGDDGGTGLGLSIVHGIVTRCDGRIAVASHVGRGSQFTVDLPIRARRRTAS